MKRPLILTAVIELSAGAALLCCPSAAARLLLGSPLDTPATALGRLAGVALLALGVANWRAYYDAQSGAARGVVMAMTLYNLGAVVVLGAAGIRWHPAGIALWPAVLLHSALAVWCIRTLLGKPVLVGRKELSPKETQPQNSAEHTPTNLPVAD